MGPIDRRFARPTDHNWDYKIGVKQISVTLLYFKIIYIVLKMLGFIEFLIKHTYSYSQINLICDLLGGITVSTINYIIVINKNPCANQMQMMIIYFHLKYVR